MEWLILLGVFFLFVRFVIVKEGTAVSIMTFGKFWMILFQWEGHWMNEKWKILREGEESKYKKKIAGLRILGGLYLYGIWPIHRIHHYKHRWTDIRIRETGKMDLEFHEEELNHILLKPAVYAIQLFAVETAPPERIPVDVLVLITLRIENPFLFLFVAPPTPIEDVLARISASMRPIITGCRLDNLLRLKGESFWMEEKKEKPEEKRPLLKGTKVIEDTLKKWGMKLADKGIEIKEIDLPPEYQKAGAAKKEQEMKAAGRAEEIMGTVISAVARAEGRDEKKIQVEFRTNPQAFYQKHQPIVDNTITKLSMEEKAYLRIETPGATAFGGEFLRLIGSWLRMPMGKPEGEKPAKEEKKEEKETKKDEEKEMDEAEKEMEKLTAEAEKEAKRLEIK